MQLHPGTMVLYRWRSGQVRAGMTEAAAMITRLHADGTANLIVFPDGDRDTLLQQRVPPLSKEVQHHCWFCSAGTAEEEIVVLTKRVAQLEADLSELREAAFGSDHEPSKSKRRA